MRTLEGTYGCRRIQAFLERRGVRADGATIRSIMRELGLQAAQLWARLRATVPAAISMSALASSGGTSPPSHQDVSCAGISPTSARGPGSSVLRPSWTAAPRKSWAMRWSPTCALPWCEAIDVAVRRCPIERDVTISPLRPGGAVRVNPNEVERDFLGLTKAA